MATLSLSSAIKEAPTPKILCQEAKYRLNFFKFFVPFFLPRLAHLVKIFVKR